MKKKNNGLLSCFNIYFEIPQRCMLISSTYITRYIHKLFAYSVRSFPIYTYLPSSSHFSYLRFVTVQVITHTTQCLLTSKLLSFTLSSFIVSQIKQDIAHNDYSLELCCNMHYSLELCCDMYYSLELCCDMYYSLELCCDMHYSLELCCDMYYSLELCCDIPFN